MRAVACLLVAMFAALAAGCTGLPDCMDPDACVDVEPGEPLRLGAALALSGPEEIVQVGEDSLRAVALAVDLHDPIAGHGLEVAGESSGCSEAGGAEAGALLAADSRVLAVVGTTCSSAAAPAASALAVAGLSLVSPSNTSPLLTDPGTRLDGYFRVSPDDGLQAARLASFAAEDLGLLRAAVAHDGSEYWTAMAGRFEQAFEADGGAPPVPVPAWDSPAALVDGLLAQEAPDLLFVALPAALAAEVAGAVRSEPGLANVLMAGTDALLDQAFVQAEGGVAEGSILCRWDFHYGAAGYESFTAAWNARWDTPPQGQFHAHAWDATQVVLAAVERTIARGAGGRDRVDLLALRAGIQATAGLPGLTGLLSCDADGDCAAPTPIEVLRVEGGQAVPVGR